MQDHSNIPVGLCQCGCGQRTTISSYSCIRRNRVKGQPMRYVEHHKPRGPLLTRFLAKIRKSVGENGHWLWTGGTAKGGYGTFYVPERGLIPAHRFAYESFVGPIPDGLWVLHSCDIPPCVNPAHLFLGTHQDNMNDMVKKGRSPRGERAAHAKLTDREVLEIRCRYASGGLTWVKLATQFGVTPRMVAMIVNRICWRHL